MQEFSQNRSPRFISRRPALVAACAIVLIGGGAFAAAGGIDLLKRYFVTVDVGGQALHLELQPTGEHSQEGSLDTQLADGRQAKIQVQRTDAGENQQKMQVRVNLTGEGTQTESDSEIAIRRSANVGADSNTTYTVADLGDAEPAHEWTNSQGEGRALYLIPNDDGQLRIFSVRTAADGAKTVRMLTQLPSAMGFEGTPEVTTGANDTITLTWGSGDGDAHNRRVIKLMDRTSSSTIDASADLRRYTRWRD
jgi:hypothetical protein